MATPETPMQDVAVIVDGGPGISASCARLFAKEGMRVAVAARQPDKPVLQALEKDHGVRRYACDAADPAAIERLFQNLVKDLGTPTLVVHNIDGRVPGIFGKGITEAEPDMAFDTLRNAAFSAFLVGQQAARLMRENEPSTNGAKGTIIFTNASASLKGFAKSGAFAMACHAKSGLAQSMARELGPKGIHVAHVIIDGAIDGDFIRTSFPQLYALKDQGGILDPAHIAEQFWMLHTQPRDAWTFELDLRPWMESW